MRAVRLSRNMSLSCDFGACGAGPSSLTPGQTASLAGPILIPPSCLLSVVNLFHFPYGDSSDPNHRLFGTHYCGPGDGGAPTGGLDQLCAAHDACYRANGVSAIDNLNPFTFSNGRLRQATMHRAWQLLAHFQTGGRGQGANPADIWVRVH
jgi:hypothetical protein